jgi:hypothetical protein
MGKSLDLLMRGVRQTQMFARFPQKLGERRNGKDLEQLRIYTDSVHKPLS